MTKNDVPKKKNDIKDPLKSRESYPYGVRLNFVCQKYHYLEDKYSSFLGIWLKACLMIDDKLIFEFVYDTESENKDEEVWDLFVEGFEKAHMAEKIGERISVLMMLFSLVCHTKIQLRYITHNICEVYSRRLSREPHFKMKTRANLGGSLYEYHSKSVERFSNLWRKIKDKDIDEKVRLAFEIYTSSRFETSERARFIGLVTTIECLAIQIEYNDETINNLKNELIEKVNGYSGLDKRVKKSLIGKIGDSFTKEGVVKACARLLNERIPNIEKNDIDDFKQAYNIRSRMLHDGEMPKELHEIDFKLSVLIRKLLTSYFNN